MTDSVLKQIADLPSLSYEELEGALADASRQGAAHLQPPIPHQAARLPDTRAAYGGLSENARAKMREVLTSHGYDENGLPAGPRRKGRGTTRICPSWAPALSASGTADDTK